MADSEQPDPEPEPEVEMELHDTTMPDGARVVAAFVPGVDPDDQATVAAQVWAELEVPEDQPEDES